MSLEYAEQATPVEIASPLHWKGGGKGKVKKLN